MSKPSPNWAIYRHMPALDAEDAVALAIGLDPKALMNLRHRGWAYTAKDRWRTVHELPDFDDKLRLLRYCHPGKRLSTVELARWALSVEWDVPVKLAELAGWTLPEPMPPAPVPEIDAALARFSMPGEAAELRLAIEKLGHRFVINNGEPVLQFAGDFVKKETYRLGELKGVVQSLGGECDRHLPASGASGSGAVSSPKTEWPPTLQELGASVLSPSIEQAPPATSRSRTDVKLASVVRPESALAAQERVILETLRALQHDPLALPAVAGRQGGAKAAVRKALGNQNSLFQSSGVFDKAWERLRSDGRLKDA